MAVFTLLWLTAARPSSLLAIRGQDITFPFNPIVTITFVRGKTVEHTGPYTLHIKAPLWLTAYLREQSSQVGQLFHKSEPMNDVRTAMRCLNSRYELRSTRRGALQYLALQGHQLEKIRLLSRNTTDAMLRRYLEWGRLAKAEAKDQAALTSDLAISIGTVPEDSPASRATT